MKKAILASAFALVSLLGATAQSSDSLAVTDSLGMMIGQMILTGIGDFSDLDKKAPVFQSIKDGKVGSIILFEKNLSPDNTSKKLKEIIQFAQNASPIPLFVSIDEEGGRVNRLKPKYGYPQTKSAQRLGTIGQPDSTYQYALKTAGTLYQLGINMNFAPTVDVNINPSNPVIGGLERSFSADPDSVALHAEQVISAHETFGITTVLKHFPGHGSSEADSHLGLADVSSTWRFQELTPYSRLLDSGKVRAVMTAHIVNQVLDDRKIPATLSDRIISDVLRGLLDFEGVVVSDDMQMRAISAEYGLEEAIKMAIIAGVDILLFANNVPQYELVTADQIHDIIKSLVKNGDITQERIAESYLRIMKLKADMMLTAPIEDN
ncbi:MAG: glycoside hydrolase family 3 protein [Cyclobacteriaceae bacterium]